MADPDIPVDQPVRPLSDIIRPFLHQQSQPQAAPFKEPWEQNYNFPATSPVIEQRARAQDSKTFKEPWEQDYSGGASNDMSTADTATDVGLSTGIGAAKGTIGMLGSIGDAGALGREFTFWLANKFGVEPEKMQAIRDLYAQNAGMLGIGGSPDIQHKVEGVTGEFRKPQSTAGEIGQSIGTFLPAAATMSPGSAVRRVVGGAVFPGVASEAAGQALDSTGYGNYARIATGLLTGAMNAATVQPATAVAAIKQNLPAGVTPQMVDQAAQLMLSPAGVTVPQTWAEALSKVAGFPVLTNVQRLTESAGPSRGQMEMFMAQRPAQIRQAVEDTAGTIAPPTSQPSMIGPQAAQTATQAINAVRQRINEITDPMYKAGLQHRVSDAEHARMLQDPVFVEALDRVRASPEWRKKIGAQSDRSLAVYDAVKQDLQERAKNLLSPVTENRSPFKSSELTDTAQATRDAAIVAERQATGGPSSYEAALENQSRMRQQYLEPLKQGALGRIANAPETKAAVEALFPSTPTAGSAAEVANAVSALAKRNPDVARQLVSQHILMQLDNAFQAAGRTSQAAQWAGGNLAKNLVGNPSSPGIRAENFQAAVEALPGGTKIWPGVRNLLDVLEATGTRESKGSLTAFNERDMQKLSTGGPMESLIKHGASPGEWWHVVHDAVGKFQLGRNFKEIGDILTNPNSYQVLRTLASTPPQSARAQALVARLIAQNQIAGSARATDQVKQIQEK